MACGWTANGRISLHFSWVDLLNAWPRAAQGMLCTAQAVAAARAAVLMSCTTSCGWETIATWLDGTSMVVAPIRLANRRWASGGSAWSSVATRYQDGSAFQAGI